MLQFESFKYLSQETNNYSELAKESLKQDVKSVKSQDYWLRFFINHMSHVFCQDVCQVLFWCNMNISLFTVDAFVFEIPFLIINLKQILRFDLPFLLSVLDMY